MKFNFFTIGILLGFLPNILGLDANLDLNSKIVLQMLITMIFFWITEAIPLSITALIPILISPFLIEFNTKSIFSSYASPVVFLLLGGFIIANGFEKSCLHQRVAIKTIIFFGKTKTSLLLCFIFITAFISMWLSNTATCLLMLPIVKFIVDTSFKQNENNFFSKILILCIAYSSSIGGMTTPIGTIPNAVMIGFFEEKYNIPINFIDWVIFIAPLSIILLIFLWLYFSFKIRNEDKRVNQSSIKKKLISLGTLSVEEKITSLILLTVASLWIFKMKINQIFEINLSDSGIALFCAFLFFVIPVNKKYNTILNADWFRNIPWNVLILFGGGLAMASLVMDTGLASEISKNIIFFKNFDIFLIILFLTLLTCFLTEFTSNTATTFLLLPLLGTFAIDTGLDVVKIILPVVLAASCAFMMPISTPPNAIVFSTGQVNISFMVKTGILMNIFCIGIISVFISLFGTLAFKL